jgi:Protein of unknown function (DUF998)
MAGRVWHTDTRRVSRLARSGEATADSDRLLTLRFREHRGGGVIGDDHVVKTKIACGVAAGPVFVGVFTVLGARRAGYDWRRHAVSSLAVGREGWGQRANFMLVGGLYCVAALGSVLRWFSDWYG